MLQTLVRVLLTKGKVGDGIKLDIKHDSPQVRLFYLLAEMPRDCDRGKVLINSNPDILALLEEIEEIGFDEWAKNVRLDRLDSDLAWLLKFHHPKGDGFVYGIEQVDRSKFMCEICVCYQQNLIEYPCCYSTTFEVSDGLFHALLIQE